MTLRTTTTSEKLIAIESMIVARRGLDCDVLKAIAADLRARLQGAPTLALLDVERRVVAVARSKHRHGYDQHALHGLGEGVAAHWATIKQALELFGAEVEGR